MDLAKKSTLIKNIFRAAIILSLIIIYPNIGDMLWKIFPGSTHHMELPAISYIYFIYRYLFFVALTSALIWLNVKDGDKSLTQRIWNSFFVALAAYAIYVCIGSSFDFRIRFESFTKAVILQFIIAWLIPLMIGYIYTLILNNQKQQKEMEVLRMENLQSRVDALSNQINPHFFFNSLNGLKALVVDRRNEETIEYVAKLSNIFRYILQSDKKGMVTLQEELLFLDAYRYLVEIRYRGKIFFLIEVSDKKMDLCLPVLSLLPLIENIIKHNIIDSDHKMTVRITLSDKDELIVSNPVYCKYHTETSHGIGLSNLSARYKLLMGSDIQIIEKDKTFSVILPLSPGQYE